MKKSYFVYGVPGVGKTYFSQKLAKQKQLQYVELDLLRNKAQLHKTKNPFVYLGTTEAYKEYGNDSYTNIVRGLIAVRNAMSKYVISEIKIHKDNSLFEGAFIDPNQFNKKMNGILITQSNEILHKEQFFRHRKRNKETLNSFYIARQLQDYLVKESNSLTISIMNSGDISKNLV